MQWQRKIFRKFYPQIAEQRGILILLSFLNTISVVSNACIVWLFGQSISHLSTARFDQLNNGLVYIATLLVLNQLIQFAYNHFYNRLTLLFVDRVRGELLTHIMELGEYVTEKFKKGDLLTRLSGNVDSLLVFVINFPLNLFLNLLLLSVYATIVLWIDYRLALVAFCMAPIFYFSQRYVAPKTGHASKNFTEQRAELFAIEEQVLTNLKAINAFNAEATLRAQHAEQFSVARSWALHIRKINVLYRSFFTFLLFVASVVIIYIGIAEVKAGNIALGHLVSFILYVRILAGPLRNLARMPITHQANRAAAERVMEILDLPARISEKPDAQDVSTDEGNIDIHQLSFKYPGQQQYIFHNFNFSMKTGECIAIVGASGSGKSTLANLLMRFIDPLSGSIAINGQDIRDLRLHSLRQTISIVWQQPLIINGSIRDNLRLAWPAASEEQMIAACKQSYAWEFIDKLSHGLDTVIGSEGIQLSFGQTQRIAVAQVFLRDSPIVILDEPSSGLDSHSESLLVAAIEHLRSHRSTLIIAHRFSSIRNADRVLYLRANAEYCLATHQQLMDSEADYRAAVHWQTNVEADKTAQ